MKKIYLIAAVIALAAGVATYFFASELKTSKVVTGVDKATVVVAVQDIEKDTVLTEEMFQQIDLPVTAVSYGTICSVKDVVGYMATDKILAGEQLMVRKIALVGDEKSDGRLSYQLENGMYAYTISVKTDNAVAYFIKEDDRINIYNDMIPSAEPVLENIPVLKIGDYSAEAMENTGTEIVTYSVVTVALTKEQIVKMLELDITDDDPKESPFRIVLVSYAEGHGIADELNAVSVPEERSEVPETNYGMGQIAKETTTAKAE